MSYRYVHLQFTIYETIDVFELFHFPLKTDRQTGETIGAWIEELLLLHKDSAKSPLRLAAGRNELAYRFLNLLLDLCPPNERYEHFLNGTTELLPVLSYIRRNLAEPITVEKLLSISPMSRTVFFRLFHATFRQTPMNYIKTIRLNEAYRRLCATSDSVSLVSEQCGFSTMTHFCREFKQVYRLTPSEARMAYRSFSSND
ncbi:helix-turn-helix domain-containing protein [Paenibacillus sp. MBLB4367]|uniref:helix-turn-helix domain-containing protein n=1 Tax=Paenibacillus sp. MBLB4367 TaxID=3384767 RepID=UPI003907EF5B